MTISLSALRVFISYSRRDVAAADALVVDLENRGVEVNIDRRDLPYGEEWQAELAGFIAGADAVVWLVTPSSIASQWCTWELGEVQRLNKRLIPVRILETPIEQVPDWLRARHMLPAEGIYSPACLDTLIDALETDNAWIKEHTRIGALAQRWEAQGRPEWELLRGDSLLSAEKWLMHAPRSAPEPTALQRAYVTASRETRLAEEAATEQRRQHELEQARTLAEEQRARADSERRRRTEATSRQLAAQSQALRQEQFDLAILLAIEANSMAETQEARNVLLQHVAGNPHFVSFLTGINPDVPVGAKAQRPDGLAFSKDGRYFAHAESVRRPRLRVWNMSARPTLEAELDTGKEPILALDFAHDVSRLAAIDRSGVVWMWDVEPWRLMYSVDLAAETGAENGFNGNAIALSPDGECLAAAGDNTIFVLDAARGTFLSTLTLSSVRIVHSIVWSASGRQLIARGFSADDDRNATHTAIVDLSERREVRVPAAFVRPARDGRHLLVHAKNGRRLDRLDLERLAVDAGVRLPRGDYSDNAWSITADEEWLALAAKDFLLHEIGADADDGVKLVGHPVAVFVDGIAFSPDDSLFASIGFDDAAILWSVMPRHRLLRLLPAQDPNPSDSYSSSLLSFTASGDHLANLDHDGRVFVTRVSDGTTLPMLDQAFAQIEPQGNGWIGLTKDKRLCSIATGDSLAIAELHQCQSTALTFALAGQTGAGVLVEEDGQLHKIVIAPFSMTTASRRERRHDRKWAERKPMAISSDGSRVAFAFDNGEVELFSLDDSPVAPPLETGIEPNGVQFVHQGEMLLVTGPETFQLWDVASRAPVIQFGTGSGIGAPVIASISPDGSFLAWGTLAWRRVTIMDGRATQRVCELPELGTERFRGSLAFSPDGRLLAIDDGAGGALLWSFDREEWMGHARAMANRTMRVDEWRRFLPDVDYAPSSGPNPVAAIRPPIAEAVTLATARSDAATLDAAKRTKESPPRMTSRLRTSRWFHTSWNLSGEHWSTLPEIEMPPDSSRDET